MSVRDLIPWNRGRDVMVRREANPFLALHREMNRLFDDVFRGFDLAPFDRTMGWPNIEVSDTGKQMKVTVELPGLDDKDVELELQAASSRSKARRRPRRKTRTGCLASATTAASNAAFRSRTSTKTR